MDQSLAALFAIACLIFMYNVFKTMNPKRTTRAIMGSLCFAYMMTYLFIW